MILYLGVDSACKGVGFPRYKFVHWWGEAFAYLLRPFFLCFLLKTFWRPC